MAWMTPVSDADISTQTLMYTVPTGYEGRFKITFANRSTSATATVQLWIVASGDTPGNQNLVEPGTLLDTAPAITSVLSTFAELPVGGMIYVQASNANVSCQVTGDVVSPDTFWVTDGTSSIVYGTNWADVLFLGTTNIKKDQNGRVGLVVLASVSGSPGATILTAPAGYRPSKSTTIVGYANISGQSWPCIFSMDTAGAVSASVFTSLSSPSISSGTTVSFSMSYFI